MLKRILFASEGTNAFLTSARPSRRRPSGYTALEYAGVAALIGAGVLITMASMGVNNDKKSYNQFVGDTAMFLQNLHDYYAGTFGVATIATGAAGTLITAGVAPTTVSHGSAATLTNAFGGGVSYTGNTTNGYLDQDSIPQAWCIKYLTGAPVTSTFIGVQVASGTTAAPGAFAPGAPAAPPVSQANAATYCAQASNVIRINFR